MVHGVVSVQGNSAAQVGIMIRRRWAAGANMCTVRLFVVDLADGADEHGGEQFVQSVGSGTRELDEAGEKRDVFSMYGSADGVNWVGVGDEARR